MSDKIKLGEHTKGPWYAQGSIIAPTPTGRRFAIAEVFRDNVDAAKANARLIAAAPDLLEALRECRKALAFWVDSDNDSDNRTLLNADAAIAKAEGRS